MVHRQVRLARRLVAVTIGILAVGLLSAAVAGAANTRVSISDFRWSQEPTVDLGESVTWDWLGPDLQHSVTGQSENAAQWDSDPGIPSPMQPLGRTFTVSFDEPGKYLFVCKLHPQAVRGTVTVTDQPGDPNSDPGPQPALNFDLVPPQVDNPRLMFMNSKGKTVLGPKGKGTKLDFEVGETGTASVEFFQVVTRGKGKNRRNVRRFAGYQETFAHVGLNSIRFAHRTPTFRAQPGRYVGVFRVYDNNTNSSPNFPLRFEIKAKAKKKRR